MANKIEHLPIKVANQLVSSAKVSTLASNLFLLLNQLFGVDASH
jgi:hypothetical protein